MFCDVIEKLPKNEWEVATALYVLFKCQNRGSQACRSQGTLLSSIKCQGNPPSIFHSVPATFTCAKFQSYRGHAAELAFHGPRNVCEAQGQPHVGCWTQPIPVLIFQICQCSECRLTSIRCCKWQQQVHCLMEQMWEQSRHPRRQQFGSQISR